MSLPRVNHHAQWFMDVTLCAGVESNWWSVHVMKSRLGTSTGGYRVMP